MYYYFLFPLFLLIFYSFYNFFIIIIVIQQSLFLPCFRIVLDSHITTTTTAIAVVVIVVSSTLVFLLVVASYLSVISHSNNNSLYIALFSSSIPSISLVIKYIMLLYIIYVSICMYIVLEAVAVEIYSSLSISFLTCPMFASSSFFT